MNFADIDLDFSYKTALLVDAMYYHAAQRNLGFAMDYIKNIKVAKKRCQDLRRREYLILKKYRGDSYRAGDKLEPIYIQMESAEYTLGEAYGPYLQSIAIVHILCAAALESHINIKATTSLKGKALEQFERFSLEAKWLFLPKLLGVSGFDPGKRPFQSFSRLIKLRNELVHYKEKTEDWRSPRVPSFLKKLGLTLKACKQSIETVEKMISELSTHLKLENPHWLTVGNINYFDFRIEELKR